RSCRSQRSLHAPLRFSCSIPTHLHCYPRPQHASRRFTSNAFGNVDSPALPTASPIVGPIRGVIATRTVLPTVWITRGAVSGWAEQADKRFKRAVRVKEMRGRDLM